MFNNSHCTENISTIFSCTQETSTSSFPTALSCKYGVQTMREVQSTSDDPD